MKKLFTIFLVLLAFFASASHVHLSLTGVTSGTHFNYCSTTVDSVIVYKPAGAGVGDWYHSGLGTFSADSAIVILGTQGYWYFDDGTMIEFYIDFTSIAPAQPWTATDTTKCTENSIVLKAQATTQPDFIYTWSTGSNAAQITVSTPGTYMVTVTGVCGSPMTDQINVINHPVPTPNLGPDVVTCDGNIVILDPGTFAGYAWSTSVSTSTISVTTSDEYSVTVTDTNGCLGRDTINVSFVVNTGQQFKLVTIDTLTGNNMPTWDVLPGTANVSVKIYRNGTFVSSTAYDDGYLVDVVNSSAHTWSYQMSTIDTCGNESPLSLSHSTISTATVPLVGGGFRVEWTQYLINGQKAELVDGYDLLSVGGFGTNWSPVFIDSVNYDVTSYNLLNATDSLFVVGAKLATGTKSTTQLALSNVVTNPIYSGVVTEEMKKISIYPNPSSGEFTVSGEGMLTIHNLVGQCVLTDEINGVAYYSLVKGMYCITITKDKSTFTQKIIIQ